MDLQTQDMLGTARWNIAKVAAALCFVLASGFLISALTGAHL